MRTADDPLDDGLPPDGASVAFGHVAKKTYTLQALLGAQTVAPLMRIQEVWGIWASEHLEDEHAQAADAVAAGLAAIGQLCDVLLDVPRRLWQAVSRALDRDVLQDVVQVETPAGDDGETEAYLYHLQRVEEAVHHLQTVAGGELRASPAVRKRLLLFLARLHDALEKAGDVLSPEEAVECEPP
jgi:hypothetical protein